MKVPGYIHAMHKVTYYLKRMFSESILSAFNSFLCTNQNKAVLNSVGVYCAYGTFRLDGNPQIHLGVSGCPETKLRRSFPVKQRATVWQSG